MTQRKDTERRVDTAPSTDGKAPAGKAPAADARSAVASRRDALVRLAGAGVVLTGAGAATAFRYDGGGYGLSVAKGERQVRDFTTPAVAGKPTLAIARQGGDPAALARAAVDALGGMRRFIQAGDVVAIKPNIGWDRQPVHAANTNPQVVAEVVKMCREAGASQVIVTDASCNEARRSFQRSGIWRAAHEVGATVVIPAEHRFRELRLRGDVLDQWPVYTPLINADKVINVPIAKHHNLSRFTGAMKNWYGLLGGRRNRLHQNIHTSIADLATFMRPTLTIMDATRVLMRNGPQGGNMDDARHVGQVLASIDQVTIDGYACTLIGEKRERIEYLKLGHDRGLGNADWKSVPHVFV